MSSLGHCALFFVLVAAQWLVDWAGCQNISGSTPSPMTQGYVCPRNDLWVLMQAPGNNVRAPLCYRIMEPAPFRQALELCHVQHASLYALDCEPEQVQREDLLQLLTGAGITDLWTGFYIQDDRMRQDTFPMPKERSQNFRNMAHGMFLDSNCTDGTSTEPSGLSNCFQIAVKSSDLCPPLERLKRSAKFKDDREVEMDVAARRKRQTGQGLCRTVKVISKPCNASLAFVCVKEAFDIDSFILKNVTLLCEDDQFGSVNSTRCFSFGQEAVNYTTAQARCRAQPTAQRRPPRTLYDPRPEVLDGTPTVNKLVAEAVNLQLSNRMAYGTQAIRQQTPDKTGRRMGWVERGGSGECRALDLDDVYYRTVPWNCSAYLPFYLCQQPVYLPAAAKPVLEVDPNQLATSQFVISEIPGSDGDLEMLVPPSFTDPNPPEGALLLRCRYSASPPLIPELQSLLLVKSGIPVMEFSTRKINSEAIQENIRFLTKALELRNGRVYFGELPSPSYNMTDYYWCEVNDLQSGTVLRSPRLFVRPERVPVYAVSVSTSPELSLRPRMLLESWTLPWDKELYKTLFATLAEWSLRALRVRPHPSKNNLNVVDFHFYKTLTGSTYMSSNVASFLLDLNPTTTASTGFFPPENGSSVAAEDPRLATLRDLDTVKDAIKFYFTNDRELLMDFQFDAESVVVRSIDVCPYIKIRDPVSGNVYEILDTPLGKVYTSTKFCFANGEPFVNLRCQGDKLYGAYWSQFTPITGCNFTGAAESWATRDLRTIAKSDINNKTGEQTVLDVKAVVDTMTQFLPLDLIYLADIVQQVVDAGSVSEQTGNRLLQIFDKVAQVNSSVLNSSNVLGNATNRVLKSLDVVGDRIVLSNDTVRLVGERISVETWNLHKVTGDLVVGLELMSSSGRSISGKPVEILNKEDMISLTERKDLTYRSTDAAIVLPAAFLKAIKNGSANQEMRLSMSVYADTSLFSLGTLEPAGPDNASSAVDGTNGSSSSAVPVLNSKVVSARLTVGGQEVKDLNGSVVTTVFLPYREVTSEFRDQNSTCVFWDFQGSGGRGSWSSEGCRYRRIEAGRDVCECDHLTNFAVLLDVYGQQALPQGHQTALSVVTIIGLSLSIAGLSLTVLSFIFIRKLRQSMPQQTLFNMALAMLASWVTFLAGFSRVDSPGGCLAVAVLLHYLILVSFMWMLMEGLLQYLLFVRVLGNDFSHYLLKTAIPAWGLPLIPVIILLSIDVNLYRGGDYYCWMSLSPFYYAFLAPVALVIFINIIVYILVVVNICRRGASLSSSASNKRQVGIRASVACFIVLGLSWVFAFLAVEEARLVFQYLFVVTASLQGFLIFLIFTARDPQVRDFWWNLLCRRLKCREPWGSRSTSNNAQTTSDFQPQRHHLRLQGAAASYDVPTQKLEKKGRFRRDGGAQHTEHLPLELSPQNSTATDSTS